MMIKELFSRITVLGVFIVPLRDPSGWEKLSYKGIPTNEVTWSAEGMVISVEKSASPLIYPLKSLQKVSKLSAKGKIVGELQFSKSAIQGERGADDFQMRIGLVIPGKKKLNWFERKLAPGWVLKLQSLAPKDSGIDKVLFFNLASQDLSWKQREHPLSEYLVERIVGRAESEFIIDETFSEPLDVVAIWISVDGDDLKQSYKTIFSEIKLLEP